MPKSKRQRIAHTEDWKIIQQRTLWPEQEQIEEGVKGLDDKSRAPKSPARKVTLEAMQEVKRLQPR